MFYHFLQCKCRNKYWQIQYDVWSICSMMYALSWWWFWWFWCWWWWWWGWGSGWDDDDDDDHDDESFGLSVGMPVGLLKSQPSSQDQMASVSTRRPWAKRHWILSGSLFLAKPSFFMVKPCTFIDGLNMVKSFFMVSSHPDYHPKEENIIPSLHVKHHHSPKYVYAHKFPVKPFLGRVSSIRGKGSVG